MTLTGCKIVMEVTLVNCKNVKKNTAGSGAPVTVLQTGVTLGLEIGPSAGSELANQRPVSRIIDQSQVGRRSRHIVTLGH